MSVTRLTLEVEYDFGLVAVNSSSKEYRLAWELEQALELRFVKSEDVLLEFVGNKNMSISMLMHEEELGVIRLLKNKANSVEGLSNTFLVPELKEFDYLILLEDVCFDRLDDVYDCVRQLPTIQYCKLIDPEDLKSKDNLLF